MAAEGDVLEMRTRSLLVSLQGVDRTPARLEVLSYSLKNTTQGEVRVLLVSDATSVGLCREFQESSVPLMESAEFPNTKGRGVVLKAGEQQSQRLVLSKECIRQSDVLNFLGHFFVRRSDGLIGGEAFALGNVYFQQ
jgi:hypothetical protein